MKISILLNFVVGFAIIKNDKIIGSSDSTAGTIEESTIEPIGKSTAESIDKSTTESIRKSTVGNYQVVRIDRQSPYSNDKQMISLLATPNIINATSKALSADEAFLVRLTCPGIDPTTCQKVNVALENAGKRLVENLLITRQIVLKATFRSFCGGQSSTTCTRANTLGSATYGSAFVVKDGDTHYSIDY